MTTRLSEDLKQQALRTFERDLPQLYRERPGQWVAYQGDRQLGFAAHKHLLYQECLGQGLPRDDFVIFCIEPQETEMTLGPVVLDRCPCSSTACRSTPGPTPPAPRPSPTGAWSCP